MYYIEESPNSGHFLPMIDLAKKGILQSNDVLIVRVFSLSSTIPVIFSLSLLRSWK